MNEDYIEYLKSQDWRDRRKELLEEANFICCECGEKATVLHHLKYDNLGFEILDNDVIALCKECHKEIHMEKDNDDYGGINNGYGGY